jgi:stage V sporulation protein AF
LVLCYLDGKADPELLDKVRKKLASAHPDGVPLGYRSIAETIIGKGWLNPFPKIRLTERPDTAAAHILEGSVILITDTCPQAMILPTSFFDFMQQTDDYYFPPLTGSYLRAVRMLILLLSVVITPLWYLAVEYGEALPPALAFLYPDEPGALPIIAQLLLAEIAIDGLKIASMNTPNMLSSSLSVVGALILGDFAVGVGWLCEDVILYMAFIAISGFAQQNAELGYAFKFFRVVTLLLVFIFGVAGLGLLGLLLGLALMVVALLTNNTLTGSRGYLYPLIPFNGAALSRLLLRRKKR